MRNSHALRRLSVVVVLAVGLAVLPCAPAFAGDGGSAAVESDSQAAKADGPNLILEVFNWLVELVAIGDASHGDEHAALDPLGRR